MIASRFKSVSCLVMVLLLVGGCGSSGGFNLVSIEEEWQLGNQLAADIARQMPLLQDPAALAYVNEVGQRLVAQTSMANLPWRFYIVAENDVNAFVIPGGHVYVNVGLIAAADTASELVGVLAHEISHGVARHATQQLSRAYGLQVVAALVLGQNPAIYQQILAQILGTGAMASFSREAEREADMMGVRVMYDAGYNPNGMVTMFEELLSRQARQPGSVERFFSTHPLTQDRIRDVSNEIARLPAKANLVSDTTAYQSFRQRVTR
ncbi:MAG TPA: M48 family metallopeptidase [Thermoanaerobaculia bacterium]|nr:M48 family metallopeptidase [Thermoanaerobaculia bacterium]